MGYYPFHHFFVRKILSKFPATKQHQLELIFSVDLLEKLEIIFELIQAVQISHMPWYSFFLWELQNLNNDLELTFVPKQRMSWSNGSNLKKIGRKGIPRFTVQPKCNITYKNYLLIMTLICKWNSVNLSSFDNNRYIVFRLP